MRFLLLICFSLSVLAGPSHCIRDILDILSHKEIVWTDDTVEVVYFPGRQHMKLVIGDTAYGNECPHNTCARTSVAALNRLSRSTLTGGPQFRFKIRVREDEVPKMLEFINSGRFAQRIDCAHSVCSTLNETTGMWVPFPVSVSPFSTAINLSVQRILPGTRVIGMKFLNGPMKASNILFASMAPFEPVALSLITMSATGLTFVIVVHIWAWLEGYPIE